MFSDAAALPDMSDVKIGSTARLRVVLQCDHVRLAATLSAENWLGAAFVPSDFVQQPGDRHCHLFWIYCGRLSHILQRFLMRGTYQIVLQAKLPIWQSVEESSQGLR
jgi:hypothetical protein